MALSVLIFLYAPLVAVAVFSVNQTRYGLTWGGWTWQWYRDLFHNEALWEMARNTLILACTSTLISTVLGTALALGLRKSAWGKRLHSFWETVLYLPVVTPDIILAAALVVAFAALQHVSSVFEPGMTAMIIAHVTFQISFVTLVVQSRLVSLGSEIEEAAYDLYASYPECLFRVVLPLVFPGIVAGAMLAFTLSLDDFIISLLTSGPDSQTLPLFIYGSLKRGVTPEIHALSTLILGATVVLVLVSERLTRNRV